jgi:Domain of unknown function DUF11
MSRGKLLAIAGFACLVAAGWAIPTAAKGPSGPASGFQLQPTPTPPPLQDVQVTKSVVGSGPALTYVIGVLNDGPLPTTQTIALTDTTEVGPGGTLLFNSLAATADNGGAPNCSPPITQPTAPTDVNCSEVLGAGGRLTVTIGASCAPQVTGSIGFRVTNTATATGNFPDLTPTNNTAKALLVDCVTQSLAVTMVSFRAVPGLRKVVLRWRTGSELDLLGFQVWRSRHGAAHRLNRRLIPAKGLNGVGGASYRLVDRSVRPGVRYRYRLQAVELNGTRVSFPALSVRAHR